MASTSPTRSISGSKDIVRTIKAGDAQIEGTAKAKAASTYKGDQYRSIGALREMKAQGLGGHSALVERTSIGYAVMRSVWLARFMRSSR